MSFVIRNTTPAEHDAWEAVRWYEAREAGLGSRFLDAVAHAVASLAVNPMIYRQRRDGLRRIAVPGFEKYGVFYRVRGEEIFIAAVFHGARHPRRLAERSEGHG